MRLTTGILILVLVAAGVYFFVIKQNSENLTNQLIGVWKLESYNDLHDAQGSITFEKNNNFSAKVCNSYDGSYVVKNGHLKFVGNVSQTLMGCIGTEGKAETVFDQLIKGDMSLKFEGEKLVISRDINTFIFSK